MVIGSCQLDLRLPGCHSLKEKRHVLKRVIAQIRSRYNVSVSEVGDMELWQRTLVGIALVANDRVFVESTLMKIIAFIDSRHDMEIIDRMVEYF